MLYSIKCKNKNLSPEELGVLDKTRVLKVFEKEVLSLENKKPNLEELIILLNNFKKFNGKNSSIIKETLLSNFIGVRQFSEIEIIVLKKILFKNLNIGISRRRLVDLLQSDSSTPGILKFTKNTLTNKSGLPPIPFMLSGSCISQDEVCKKLKKNEKIIGIQIQEKFDGERIQVHYYDKEVRIYSRSLMNVTSKLKFMETHILEFIKVKSVDQ